MKRKIIIIIDKNGAHLSRKFPKKSESFQRKTPYINVVILISQEVASDIELGLININELLMEKA